MARLGTLSLGDCASWCAFVPAPDSWLGSSCADCISVTGAGTETPGTDDSAPAATPAVQEIVAVSPTVSVASAALSCPAGSTCTIISGVPDTAVYTLGAILAVFLFMGVSGK